MNLNKKVLKNIITENTNKILNEYADKYHLMALYKYLTMSEEEKIKDCVYAYYDYFDDFLNSSDFDFEEWADLIDSFNSNDYEDLPEEILHGKFAPLKEMFYSFLEDELPQGGECPPYFIFDEPKLLKNEWLIHFSDNAAQIAQDGFAYGTEDYENLAWSGCGISNKFGEGFDFAYDTYDFNCYYYGRRDEPKYGKEAVIFQASGVKAYHIYDEEEQVIFWGPSAKNFIYIEYDSDYEWCVRSIKNGNILFYDEDIDVVVSWAIENYSQYQRPMVNYSANKRNKKYETNYE